MQNSSIKGVVEKVMYGVLLFVPALAILVLSQNTTLAANVDRDITSCSDLETIRDNLDDNYTLTQDIDCYHLARTPVGSHEEPFTGIFNGAGHTIRTYVGTGVTDYAGLFGSISGAEVHDLNLEGLVIANGSNVGGLAGEATGNSRVTHVTSSMEIQATGDNAGGLIGALVTNVTGSFRYNSASGDVSGDGNVGGLYGYATLSNISKSFATGNVTAEGDNAGGLIGYSGGYGASEVYATGNVQTATQRAGGLIGLQEGGDISDSYARGNASAVSPGYYAGGLIGAVNGTYVRRSYSTGSATGSLAVGGLIGYSVGETYVYDSFSTGLTEGESATINSFIGQDFDGVLITANAYANADNNQFCMVGPDNQDRGGCTQISINEHPTQFFAASDEPLRIGSEQVWDITDIWQTSDSDYPTLRSPAFVRTGGQATADVISAEDGSAIRIKVSGCNAISATPTTESNNQTQDTEYSYPSGFVGFTLQGCVEGGTANITATFAGSLNLNSLIVRKYNSSLQTYTTLTSANSNIGLTSSTLNDNPAVQVNYDISDGGELDEDTEANGTIIDPVGIAIQPATPSATLAPTGASQINTTAIVSIFLFASAGLILTRWYWSNHRA